MEFLSYLISGLSLGSVYAIIALGYTMVYGIAKMLNFAHGDVIMVGCYISFTVVMNLGMNKWLSVLSAIAVCTLLGVIIEGLAYRPLRQAPKQPRSRPPAQRSQLLAPLPQQAWRLLLSLVF